jgi:hypothetical protein
METQYNITKQQSNRLYQTIKDIHDVFVKNDIGYWVTGGTLIGALRHRGIVPWDDDGDICMMKKDVQKFKKFVVPQLEKMGYFVEEGRCDDDGNKNECTGKRASCTWFIEPDSKHSLGVDVFVMERVGPLITYADPGWRDSDNGGLSCFFLNRYTFPLVPVIFGNFWVLTPFNAVEHLNQCYGVDWNSSAQRLFDHREGKWIESEKVRMLAQNYETIPPPKNTCALRPPPIKSCMKYSRPTKRIEDLTKEELKIIARLFNLKGNIKSLKDQIKKIA